MTSDGQLVNPDGPTPDQRKALQAVYDIFRRDGIWPTFQYVDTTLDRDHELEFADVAAPLRPDLIRFDPYRLPASQVSLTVRGIERCTGSKTDLELFMKMLMWLLHRQKEWRPSSPTAVEHLHLTSEEAMKEWWEGDPGPARLDLLKAFEMAQVEGLTAFSSLSDDYWEVEPAEDLRKLRGVSDIYQYLGRRVPTFDRFGNEISGSWDPREPEPPTAAALSGALPDAKSQNPYVFRDESGPTSAEGSSPHPGADTTSDKPVDVFISHASEDKEDVARPLSDALTRLGWSVWLDELELKLGDSLSRRIDAALAHSRFGIVILSPAFFAKEWPQLELSGLAARELATGGKVILPVWHNVDHKFIAKRSPLLADRLGVLTSIGIDRVASKVAEVLGEEADGKRPEGASGIGNEPAIQAEDQASSLFQVPVTDGAQEQLIRDEPQWWEYRLYAGALMQGRIELEGKWHDHELRLPRGPRRMPSESPSQFLSRETAELSRFMETLDRVFDPGILEQAFGPPGQPGDSRRIVHVARGVIQVYESMMDWAAELRSASLSSDYHEILELTARMADGPVRQTRDFIQRSADQIARIPLLIEEAKSKGATTESPMEVELVLHVELDSENQRQLQAAIARHG